MICSQRVIELFLFKVLADHNDHKNPDNIERKDLLPEEEKIASNFLTVWDFEGRLKYSPLFYG